MVARKFFVVLLALGIASGLLASASAAQPGHGGSHRHGGWNAQGWSGQNGFCYPAWGYDMGRVPYYALFPPVYYSEPVSRPYGQSPLAYPPGTPDTTPDQAGAESRPPLMIVNPYVSEAGKASNPVPPAPAPAKSLTVYPLTGAKSL